MLSANFSTSSAPGWLASFALSPSPTHRAYIPAFQFNIQGKGGIFKRKKEGIPPWHDSSLSDTGSSVVVDTVGKSLALKLGDLNSNSASDAHLLI